MNYQILITIFLLFIVFSNPLFATENRDIFDDAKVAFDAKDFEKAYELSSLYLEDSLNTEALLTCKALIIKAVSTDDAIEAIGLLKQARKLGKKKLSTRSYIQILEETDFLFGKIYYFEEDYKKAVSYYEKLDYPLHFEVIDEKYKEMRLLFLMICNSYRELDELNKVIEYGEKVLDESEKVGENSLTAETKVILAEAYFKLQNTRHAIRLQVQANVFFEKEKKYYDLAEGKLTLAHFIKSAGELEDVRTFTKEATELCTQYGFDELIIRVQRCEAETFFDEELYEKAYMKLDTALQAAKKINDEYEVNLILAWQAKAYLEQGKPKLSLERVRKIDIEFLEKYGLEEDVFISEVLGNVYEEVGNYKLSQTYFKRANDFREIMLDRSEERIIEREIDLKHSREFQRIRTSARLTKEEEKNRKLSSQLERLKIVAGVLAFAGLSLLILLGRFLFSVIRKRKAKTKPVQEGVKIEKQDTIDNSRKEKYYFQGRKEPVSYEEIICFHKQKEERYVKIFLANEQIVLEEKTIKSLEGNLPQNLFFKTNQSWIVNLEKIDDYKRGKDTVALINGKDAKVSRNRRKELYTRWKAMS